MINVHKTYLEKFIVQCVMINLDEWSSRLCVASMTTVFCIKLTMSMSLDSLN